MGLFRNEGPRILRKKPTAAILADFAATMDSRQMTFDPNLPNPQGRGFRRGGGRIAVGEGIEAWEAACATVRTWRHFPRTWIDPHCTRLPVAVNDLVITVGRFCGLQWLNACRITAVDDAPDDGGQSSRRFAISYVTLPGHIASGVETFSVTQDEQGTVWYEIDSWSRPQCLVGTLAAPLLRRLQRRFVSESLALVAEAARRAAPNSASVRHDELAAAVR